MTIQSEDGSGEADERQAWWKKSEEALTKAWDNPDDDVFHELLDGPFDQAPKMAAITTRQVINDGLPVLRVTHFLDDNSWAFLCGTTEKQKTAELLV
jgi:hypothetical protein